ncbi:sodium/hydrogen exchanger 8-like [Physella acuta]|uniref:sodium/hydrogen exchanger 8-like n=1 Tax=Physella acuta TaxID=109671 RepID=UPI0027DBF276|nr:sodium/hydrogen exchanger 8-like [Physella acuta]XP_059139557.1 sodium/hydrogen exchanger 8-like [Physella acuta]
MQILFIIFVSIYYIQLVVSSHPRQDGLDDYSVSYLRNQPFYVEIHKQNTQKPYKSHLKNNHNLQVFSFQNGLKQFKENNLNDFGVKEERNSIEHLKNWVHEGVLTHHQVKRRSNEDSKDNNNKPEQEKPVDPVVTAAVNDTSHANQTTANVTETEVVLLTTPAPHVEKPELPPKGAAEEEHHSSLTIFFILLVVAISILVVHLLIQTKFHYLPDSIAIVLIGACIGLLLKLFKFGNWKNEEAFPPTVFFIVLLPPIIFEGGYNLHKGNFFHNIGSILVFAVFGTVISAVVVGGGVYLLGQAEVAYKLDVVESFAFGSLVSAVDPVATLAIFQALDVDPILYMLVFGESMLNDAVSIVLTTTLLEFASPSTVITSGTAAFFQAVGRFCLMFFASAAIGVAFGLVSAMITKFLNLHKTPSLEVGMVFCFSYLPYALAEGIHLSGIMAILFCGIVMSHYTHFNLSPVSQITVQQTFRSIAFIAETCVFAYLGLAIFSFKVNVKPAFTIWSIVLILIGRAFNIFPLSFLMNFFREHKITKKNQFIMWFSGLRGAVAFALSLHMELEEEKHYVLVTTTLIMVLFTVVFLGGSTMPLLKFLQKTDKKFKKKKKFEGEVSMSKTKEMGDAIDSEHLSELTEEDETHVVRPHLKGFLKLDVRYLIPFFTKRFTQQEMREGRSQVDVLTNQWEMEVRAAPSESEDEEETHFDTSLVPLTSNNGSILKNGNSSPKNRV